MIEFLDNPSSSSSSSSSNSGKKFKYQYKIFDYINYLTDFFNAHPEYELVDFCLGKTEDEFVSVYKDYTVSDEEKDTNNSEASS